MDSIKIGNTIYWSSAAGPFIGVVKNIRIAKNADKKLYPWIDIAVEGRLGLISLCASDSSLKMMKVAVVE